MRVFVRLKSSFKSSLLSSSSPFQRYSGIHPAAFHTGNHSSSAQCENRISGRFRQIASHNRIVWGSLSQDHGPATSDRVDLEAEDQDFIHGRKDVHDFHDRIQSLLLRKDYHGLIKLFSATEDNLKFIQSVPENTFTEMLAHLQPKNTLEWATIPYSQLSPAMVQQLHLPSADSLIREHLLNAIQILDRRNKSGKTLSVTDYSLILGFARWTGQRDVAESFWRAMETDHVVPDLKCYNNYLGAIVSHLRHEPYASHSRRLTAFRIEARSKPSPNARHAAYKIGDGGIKQEVMSFHREMIQNDVVPDEETFRLLILGVAREGDLDTVKKILRQVWRIDVDGIVNGLEDGYSEKELDMSPTSPLYPTPFLIYAIAHAFGINNDIPTALRLVDHVSRTLKVEVFDHVWHELFNWTFVLSLPRQASRREHAYLPKASVQKIWEVMRNKPYNVRPTMSMYNKLINSLFIQQRTRDMWHYMCEALPLFEDMRIKTRNLSKALRKALRQPRHEIYTAQPVGQLHEDYMHSRVVQKTSRLWLKRWVRLLLASMHSWRKVDKDLFWSTIQIPKVILEWKEFMPSKVWYDIPGGRVGIILRSGEEKEIYQEKTMDIMDANDKVLGNNSLLPVQDGNRYLLTRRQRKAATKRGRVILNQQTKAEKDSAGQKLQPEIDDE
ncbi:hypothetical protein D6D02_04969 [Aureobasidium pullulans]|nr:hypothetical protein D6D03_01564 [Aureobasidium pullulans]THY12909.1 hypothetical protein D6D02_04969 [Aureobasidium pullulans]